MDFGLSRKTFVEALEAVDRAVEKKTTIPILSNFLLKAEDGLDVIGTDMDVAMKVRVDANVHEAGAVTVPAKKLLGWAKLLTAERITVKSDEKDYVTFKCGNSKVKMAGLSAASFPEFPALPAESLQVKASALANAVKRASIVLSERVGKYFIDGINIKTFPDVLGGSAKICGADNPQLSLDEIPITGDMEMNVILSKKAAGVLCSVAANVDDSSEINMSHDENHLFFWANNLALAARKVHGSFIAYERIMPKDHKIHVVVDAKDLAGVIQRTSGFSGGETKSICLKLSDSSLTVRNAGSATDDAEESIPIEYSWDAFEAYFRSDFILDYLALFGGRKINVCLRSPNEMADMTVVGEAGSRYLLAPQVGK